MGHLKGQESREAAGGDRTQTGIPVVLRAGDRRVARESLAHHGQRRQNGLQRFRLSQARRVRLIPVQRVIFVHLILISRF